MAQEFFFWATLLVLAALAGLAVAWWGGGRFVRGRSAVLAAAAFLALGAGGGFFLHEPVAAFLARGRTAHAAARAQELFRTEGLLRVLNEADPDGATILRARFAGALAETPATKSAEAMARLRLEALRVALSAAMARLPNASDEAAARLAAALLAALKTFSGNNSRLGVGLVHPDGDPALAEEALDALSPATRANLQSAVALTLASSVIRPHAAPWPPKADAALAEMFREAQPDFGRTYGGPQRIRQLLRALGDPAEAHEVDSQTLCSFARDLLEALLRMPPEVRGPGVRRILGRE